MQSPSVEIHALIKMAHSSSSPDIQKAAINKYFTPDAGLRHPLYVVEPGPLSREGVLGIYQWYRAIAPQIDVDIKDVVYDRLHNMVYVDLALLFHLRFSPFKPMPFRTMSRFTLRMKDGFHYVSLQEDFVHPDDMAALIIPPFTPIIKSILSINAVLSIVWGKWGQVFGIWRAPSGVDHVQSQDIATKPVKPRQGEAKLRQKERRELARSVKRSMLPTTPPPQEATLYGEEVYSADFDIFEREVFVLDSEDGTGSWVRTPERKGDRVTRTNGKRFSDDLSRRIPFTPFAVAGEL